MFFHKYTEQTGLVIERGKRELLCLFIDLISHSFLTMSENINLKYSNYIFFWGVVNKRMPEVKLGL